MGRAFARNFQVEEALPAFHLRLGNRIAVREVCKWNKRSVAWIEKISKTQCIAVFQFDFEFGYIDLASELLKPIEDFANSKKRAGPPRNHEFCSR